MKKKNEVQDKPEIVEDPTKRYTEIKRINEEMSKINYLEESLKSILEETEKNLSMETSHDPEVSKSDTVTCIKLHFEKILKEFSVTKELSSVVKEKLYFLILNTSVLIYDYCHKFRKNKFSLHGIKYLTWVITLFESNIILSGIKYLRWKVKLYSELAFLYEDLGAFKSSFKVVTQSLNKLQELKSIEEQQGTLPDYIKITLLENFRILKNLEMKYGLISGNYQLEIWKKKLDETFVTPGEKFNKFLCAVNSISNLSYFSSIIFHEGLKSTWKPSAVSYFYDLLKLEINNIKTGLLEFIQKNKREIEKREKINSQEKDYTGILQENSKLDSSLNKQWKISAKNVPIEIHMELLKAAYDCKMWKEFSDLLESLNVRIKYRNVETPFISEIDVIVSSIPYSNIPNKFVKIDIDLNINNYKSEIRKLREQGKYVGCAKKEEDLQQGQGKDLKNQKDPKAKDKNPKAVQEEVSENPYEKIEGLNHSYVYLLLRRSHNPKKAIVDFKIIMSNDTKITSLLEADQKAIAIPIKTYEDNLYEKDNSTYDDIKAKIQKEKNKLLPYLIYRKTNSDQGLNEEEKLNALVDLLPMISNSPFSEAPINYRKNPLELSIIKNPDSFEKSSKKSDFSFNFSHNYINICYKTDDIFHIIQREAEIIKNLYELEHSYVDHNNTTTSDFKNLEKVDKFLLLSFQLDKLETLSASLNGAIQGPLGNYFLNERRNFIYDTCVLIWNKYLKELLGRIDYFNNINTELEEEDRLNILEKINKIQYQLFIIILNTHFVLSNIKNKDPIIYSFLSSRLADYSEKTDNIAVGVEMLSKALEYLNQYREEENIFGMNNLENKHTFSTFTCDNNKIKNLILNNEKKFLSYVQELNLKRRRNFRKHGGLSQLTQDEEDEEDFENISLESEYENRLETIFKKVLKSFNFDEISEKEKNNIFISENENTLNCLFVELNVKFYRLYLKNGFIEKQTNMHNSLSPINSTLISNQGAGINSNFNNSIQSGNSRGSSGFKNHTTISNSTMKKLDIIKGQSATKVKESIDCLKQSLQEAGKMEPDKPTLQRYEKTMLLNISRNVYLNTIFQFSMAGARSNKQDQKYFLTQSSSLLSKCFSEEETRIKYYENYFFFIKSFQNFNKNTNQDASSFYPYSMMYKNILIENSEKIPEPILLYKTSSTATFIFPIVKIKTSGVEAKFKKASKVSLFGQQSTGTNIVQLNNKQLPGTGYITSVMNYVTVNNLKPNEKYIFAYAGYDTEDILINGIGNTSKEVESYFPLPLYYMTFHLCKISYEFKYYEICREKAKSVFNYFTEKTELKDLSFDSKSSTLNFYKLKNEYFLNTCFMEMEGIAYTFYLYAKCVMNLKINEHTDEVGVNIVTKQKNILKILNILTLALEIACYIRHNQFIKLFSKEIYSLSATFLKQKNLYKELTGLFIKLSLSLNMIPNELWDRELRNLSSLISNQLLLLLVNNNEIDLYRKLLVNDLGVQKKRFYFFKYKYMKKHEEVVKKGGKPGEKDKSSLPQGSGVPGELTETEAILFKDLEKESAELDEYILCTGDFNDICKHRITQHIVFLEKYASNFPSIPELQIELDKRKKDLNDVIEVYESYKNEGAKFLQKFAQTFRETSDKYYEFCSKLLKKTIENILQPGQSSVSSQPPGKAPTKEVSSIPTITDLLKISEDIQIKENDVNFVQGIFSQKINFLTNDVIFIMKVRIKEFLNKIEKEIKDEKINSSSGNQLSSTSPTKSEEINLEKIRIQIEEKYFGSSIENEKSIPYETLAINDVYLMKEKFFWIGDLIYNKAVLNFVEYIQNHKSLLNLDFNNFMGNYKLVDIAKISYVNENMSELNLNNLSQEKDPIIRHKRRTAIFEKLSYASLFMRESSSSRSIDNLINFAYNSLLYDMMSPIESQGENFWCYLNIISETAMKRLEKIKNGEEDFTQTDYEKEIENLKLRLSDKDNIKTMMNFNTMKNFFNASCRTYQVQDSYSDKEKLIENLESKVNLDIYIEFICFTIQCTYVAKKWNILSNLIQNFNSLTNDNLGSFTLGYLIEAQKNIYEKADQNAKNKKLEIDKRVALYETWKNSRKKNKRQQMITGEIPQEQIDFEKDHSILSKEFFILESISNLLKNDKEKSEKQYNNLISDSNNSLKAVNSCRKLFEKYQMEASILANYSSTKGENNFEVKNKTKAIKMFSSNLINLYKKSIQILKKRQENYLLIQMLYEMSLVYYSDLDYKNAEVYFNEALDTVFQKLYSLKDFRNFFSDINTKSSLVEKYGIRQLLYAVMILHKLGKFCYDNDLYWQRECAFMSGEIIYNILISSMPNPPSILNFGLYRLNEINKNLNIFKTSENVNPADLLTSCIEIVDVLNSYGNFELTLPLLSLCEHLSCDVVKNTNYLYKSRILKIISLTELGMISEAMQIFYKISKKLDLPSFISNSISVEKNSGKFANLLKEFKYNNNLPPDNAKNQESLFAFSKIFIDTELKNSLGCSLYCELLYARNLIYFKLYEKENYAIFLEKSDGRIDWLQRVEKEMRENLLMMAANEELNILHFCMGKYEANSESYNLLNKKIEEILNNRKITKDEYENFYLGKFNKKINDLRDERINLICKIRILLARVLNSQGLYLGSSGVILKSLENLKKLTHDNFVVGVEIADDYTCKYF
jgi:golgin subfamily B member 1